jgi:radical SAM superfamily enzyme YgiQ (UPF0313 family)
MKTEVKELFTYDVPAKGVDALDIYCCFPSTYYVGMSSLGFLNIFYNLDKLDFVRPHRIFTDSNPFKPDPQALMCFSFTFELDFLQIFKLLDKLKIPLKREDRDEEYPLIFAGGPVATANPEPYADFFDFFIIGDGDELAEKVAKRFHETKNLSRELKLLELAKIDGIYIPEFFEVSYSPDSTVKKITAIKGYENNIVNKINFNDRNKCVFSPIITSNTVFSDTFIIEIERGCSQKCHFCIASYLNLPVRCVNTDKILKTIDHGLKYTRKLGLLGALITEHPDIEEIFEFIYAKHKENPIKLTTTSLRADRINEKIAKILHDCNQKQITISIEAGSERLRNSINKRLSAENIFNCIKICHENNIKSIKIYGMTNLPEEEVEDIEDMINIIKKINRLYPSMEVILSLNSFIPKAHTPFERKKVENYSESKRKMEYIKKQLIHKNKVRISSSRWDALQAMLSRGDRRLSKVLIKAYAYGSTLGSFNRAFKDYSELTPELSWYATRERKPEETLPWDHIKF